MPRLEGYVAAGPLAVLAGTAPVGGSVGQHDRALRVPGVTVGGRGKRRALVAGQVHGQQVARGLITVDGRVEAGDLTDQQEEFQRIERAGRGCGTQPGRIGDAWAAHRSWAQCCRVIGLGAKARTERRRHKSSS